MVGEEIKKWWFDIRNLETSLQGALVLAERGRRYI